MLLHCIILVIESPTILLRVFLNSTGRRDKILGADSRTSVAVHKTIKKERRVVSTYMDAQTDIAY